MGQKHLFMVDPLETLNYKLDSSLRMGKELVNLGHEVYVAEIKNLFWHKMQQVAQVSAKKIRFDSTEIESIQISSDSTYLLSEFNAIHMRKEPPVDDLFLVATWLLDSVKNLVKIYNSPTALRGINEKLSIFLFQNYCADALVSSDTKQIHEFISGQCEGDAIVKPLNMFGGKGIFRLNYAQLDNEEIIRSLDEATMQGKLFRIVQPFNGNIFSGEVRAFAVGGKTIGWCLKKPAEGNFMANTSQGATLNEFHPSEILENMVSHINQELLNQGVYFVGYDIIGEHISEINITSPRLLVPPTDKYNYYKDIGEWIVKDCQK